MGVQTFLAELAIKGFDDRVVRGLTTAIEVDVHLIGVSHRSICPPENSEP